MISKRFAGIDSPIAKNVDGQDYFSEPLGLCYIEAVAEQNGWEVKHFSPTQYSSREEFLSALKSFNPDIADFSVYDNFRAESLSLAQDLKQRSSPIILFGGYHPSGCPEIVLKEEVDYVIVGDGFDAFPKLLQHVEQSDIGTRPDNIENLAYNEDDQLKLERAIRRNPFPDIRPKRHNVYIKDSKDYTLNFPPPSKQTGIAGMITALGCGYNCTFCSSSGIYGAGKKSISTRNIDFVADELEDLVKKQGVNLVILQDLNLTIGKEEGARVFNQAMRKRELIGKVFFDAYANLSTTSPESLRIWHDSGLRRIGYGIETLSAEGQKFIKKKVNLKKFKQLTDAAFELGIVTNNYFQVGLPTDTKESVREGIETLIEKKIFVPRIRFAVSTPCSGSAWFKELREEDPDFPKKDLWPYFDTAHLVFEHPALSQDDIVKLKAEMSNRYHFSEFYQKKLGEFLEMHPSLKDVFKECNWPKKE